MKNVLLLTGAAARISQEVALLDKLIERKGLEINSDNTMLAGFSSGALNIGAINACFRKNNPLSWEDYYKKELLFGIKTSDVFTKKKRLPFSTLPLLKTLTEFLDKAQLFTVKDFSFESFILAFSYRRLSTLWVSNLFNRHQNIAVADLLMATSAIPFLFPEQAIRTVDNKNRRYVKGRFADGGTNGSFKRFEYYLKKYCKQQGTIDKIYIISPMREVSRDDFDELNKLINFNDLFKFDSINFKLLRFFLEMISQNGFDTFIKRFYKWTEKHKIANEIYVCIPQMEKNYPILKFDKQEKQYNAVCQWVEENPEQLAIPLNEYVKRFERDPVKVITQKIQRKLKHRIRNIFFGK